MWNVTHSSLGETNSHRCLYELCVILNLERCKLILHRIVTFLAVFQIWLRSVQRVLIVSRWYSVCRPCAHIQKKQTFVSGSEIG